MSNMKYFDNIERIQQIISKLETETLSQKEAEGLYEIGKELIEECQSVLNGYSGTIEEINCITNARTLIYKE